MCLHLQEGLTSAIQILGLRPMTDLRLEINDLSIATANVNANESTKEKEKGRERENASGTWNVTETATDSENVIAIWTAADLR